MRNHMKFDFYNFSTSIWLFSHTNENVKLRTFVCDWLFFTCATGFTLVETKRGTRQLLFACEFHVSTWGKLFFTWEHNF